ncbi:MAG: hypothetical protein V1740_02325 [Candidatus Woesearchaeota archaeon]
MAKKIEVKPSKPRKNTLLYVIIGIIVLVILFYIGVNLNNRYNLTGKASGDGCDKIRDTDCCYKWGTAQESECWRLHSKPYCKIVDSTDASKNSCVACLSDEDCKRSELKPGNICIDNSCKCNTDADCKQVSGNNYVCDTCSGSQGNCARIVTHTVNPVCDTSEEKAKEKFFKIRKYRDLQEKVIDLCKPVTIQIGCLSESSCCVTGYTEIV